MTYTVTSDMVMLISTLGLLLLGLAGVLGHWCGTWRARREAIIHELANWVSSDAGRAQFVWRNNLINDLHTTMTQRDDYKQRFLWADGERRRLIQENKELRKKRKPGVPAPPTLTKAERRVLNDILRRKREHDEKEKSGMQEDNNDGQ